MVRPFSNASSNNSSGRGIAMLKVDQVGVRTRAQALALATRSAAAAAAATSTTSSAAKRRSRHVKISFKVRSKVVDRRRTVIISPEGNNSVPPTPELNPGDRTVNEERCFSESLEDHALSTSCCSSNLSSSDDRIKFADLEDGRVEVETSVYYSSGKFRERESTPTSSELREESSSSEAMDSTTKPTPEVNSHRRSSEAKILVTDEEVEKFFGEVKKNVPQHFKEKYNFDFDKDEPLEGRYEWVRLKP